MKEWITKTVGCDRCPATGSLVCKRLSAKIGTHEFSKEVREIADGWHFVQVAGAKVRPATAPELDLTLPADELLKTLPGMELVMCPECFLRHRDAVAVEAAGAQIVRG